MVWAAAAPMIIVSKSNPIHDYVQTL